VECDAVSFGCCLQVRANVVSRNPNLPADQVGRLPVPPPSQRRVGDLRCDADAASRPSARRAHEDGKRQSRPAAQRAAPETVPAAWPRALRSAPTISMPCWAPPTNCSPKEPQPGRRKRRGDASEVVRPLAGTKIAQNFATTMLCWRLSRSISEESQRRSGPSDSDQMNSRDDG
jgi:hypothetical protein